MKPSKVRELDGIRTTWSAEPGEPRTHVISCWREEIDTVFEARKRALIESGQAGKNDRFVVFAWPRGDEGPDDAAGPP
jgi:hypothetical protein